MIVKVFYIYTTIFLHKEEFSLYEYRTRYRWVPGRVTAVMGAPPVAQEVWVWLPLVPG